MDDYIACFASGQHKDRDRGHPAGKAQCLFRAVPDCQTVFEDFLIWRVETGIDQAFRAAGPFSSDAFKMTLAIGCAWKGKG